MFLPDCKKDPKSFAVILNRTHAMCVVSGFTGTVRVVFFTVQAGLNMPVHVLTVCEGTDLSVI